MYIMSTRTLSALAYAPGENTNSASRSAQA
jgi:hypothetical protein